MALRILYSAFTVIISLDLYVLRRWKIFILQSGKLRSIEVKYLARTSQLLSDRSRI